MKTTSLRIVTCALCLATAARAAGDPNGTLAGPPPNASADLTLERIFTSREFAARTLRAVRWLPDGSGFTVLEDTVPPAAGNSSVTGDKPEEERSQDIVLYRCPTGVREVLVASARLIPPGESRPLKIDGYRWSEDARKLLIFTNAQRVWRQNTRGDYWVLDLTSGDLRKLGGDAARPPTDPTFC